MANKCVCGSRSKARWRAGLLGLGLSVLLAMPGWAADRIGPSFAEELAAAGLMGLPFTWGPDGRFTWDPALRPEQRQQVLDVYRRHDPTRPGPPTKQQRVQAACAAILSDAASPAALRALCLALHEP